MNESGRLTDRPAWNLATFNSLPSEGPLVLVSSWVLDEPSPKPVLSVSFWDTPLLVSPSSRWCSLWARWLPGYRYQEPSLNSALVTSILRWASLWAGIIGINPPSRCARKSRRLRSSSSFRTEPLVSTSQLGSRWSSSSSSAWIYLQSRSMERLSSALPVSRFLPSLDWSSSRSSLILVEGLPTTVLVSVTGRTQVPWRNMSVLARLAVSSVSSRHWSMLPSLTAVWRWLRLLLVRQRTHVTTSPRQFAVSSGVFCSSTFSAPLPSAS